MLPGIDLTNPILDTHYELDRFEELGDDFEDDLLGNSTANTTNQTIRRAGEQIKNYVTEDFDWKWILIIAGILLALWLLYRYSRDNVPLSEIRRILSS